MVSKKFLHLSCEKAMTCNVFSLNWNFIHQRGRLFWPGCNVLTLYASLWKGFAGHVWLPFLSCTNMGVKKNCYEGGEKEWGTNSLKCGPKTRLCGGRHPNPLARPWPPNQWICRKPRLKCKPIVQLEQIMEPILIWTP